MTIVTKWYAVDNKLGVDLNNVQTNTNITTNPEYPNTVGTPALGERVDGINGSEWLFVQASTTVTAFNAVCIDENFRANNMTSALIASNVYAYGIAEFQSSVANGPGSSGDKFWALLKADFGVAVNISESAGRGVNLYVSPTVPGRFGSSVVANAINGIQLVASIGTSASSPGEALIRQYMWPALNVKVAGATV